MSTYIWLNFPVVIAFLASNEMVLLEGFTIGDDDLLFVIIILEKENFYDLNLNN